uniref:Uncharacterized protein n=1 Tax=Rhizophora mucronata TaxID=61149 RepID=A0A2P2N3B8_RHIMU
MNNSIQQSICKKYITHIKSYNDLMLPPMLQYQVDCSLQGHNPNDTVDTV